MLLRSSALAFAAVLAAGAAHAQTQTTQPPAPATDAAAPSGASNQQFASVAPAPVQPASSALLGDPAKATPGQTGVVASTPVADTPENRAKYGPPDSATGRRTQPAGN